MDKDKKEIENIIQRMMNVHDSLAAQCNYTGPRVPQFRTSFTCEELEKYIDSVRLKTLGWMFQECLRYTGEGKQLGQINAAEIMDNYDKANI